MNAYPAYDILAQMTDLRSLMDDRAAKEPDACAFFFTEADGSVREVTTVQFRDDVYALGAWLYKQGLAGKHVGILAPNSYQWVVAFTALTTGGFVAAPLDVRQPAENLVTLCQVGEVTDVICAAPFVEPLSQMDGVTAHPIDQMQDWIAEGKAAIAAGEDRYENYVLDPEAMCAIFFTSGTTGLPKGVMLSQKNMAADINAASKNYYHEGVGMSPLPMHHSFGLIVGILMVFNYRTPCFINQNIRSLVKDFQIAKPTTLFAVPMIIESFYRQLVQMQKKADGKLAPEQVKAFFGGKLRYIICGGAYLNPMYVKAMRQFGIELLNGYGITECAPVLAVNRNEDYCDGSVGPVLFGCEVKISDEGEILARGDNIMLGYDKNEEATAEAFADGWYRTGDLGKIEDHYLFITGRIKNLIITSSGENISPEELEEKLTSDPAVAEAVVYESEGKLLAEVYPEPAFAQEAPYYEALLAKANEGEPPYRQMASITLRKEPFVKNSSGKIMRNTVGQ